MDVCIQGKLIKPDLCLMELANLYTQVKNNNILVNGIKEKCMVLANFNGVMDHVIVEIICLEKSMVMANLFSTMEDIILGNGRVGDKMVKAHYILNKGK
jgi:hypothetical protein